MEMPISNATADQRTAGAPGTQRIQGTQLASVLAALMLTLLLSALDSTIVNTALPRIIGDLNGFDRYVWVATSYLLTSTTMIPIVGKLSDQFGRKWFLVAGVVVFLLGSALSGASQSMNQLILFRGLQGIGAGTILALVFTLIGDLFLPAERARWQGLFTGVFALASVVGPTLGGWITDNATWRWVFYVNLPIGVVALLLLIFRLPSHISARSTKYSGWTAIRRIDFAGVVTASAGTVCLLLGLTWGGNDNYAWGSPQVVGTLGAAAVLFVLFAIVEAFVAAEPILPLDLFKNQVFAAGAVLSLLVGMALFAVAFYLPLFIQGVMGQNATDSGLAITPLTLAMAVTSIGVGLLIARIGRYQMLSVIGALIMTFGVYLLAQVKVNSPVSLLTRDMVVVGLGMGMLMPVLTLAVQNAIPRSRLGVGTGAVTYLRSMGQTLGVAVIGVVVNNTVATELVKRLPAGASHLPAALSNPDTLEQLLTNPPLLHQITTAATTQATTQASQQAAAHVAQVYGPQIPAGPHAAATLAALQQHAQSLAVQQATTQVRLLFSQLMVATRQSLALGVSQGFVVAIFVCAGVVVCTAFLKDVPLAKRVSAPAAARSTGAGESTGLDGRAEPEFVPGVFH